MSDLEPDDLAAYERLDLPTAAYIRARLESQGYRCALSGVALTPETTQMDHAMPLSRGGTHDATNLLCVTADVNRAKGRMTVDEFVSLCCRVVALMESTGGQPLGGEDG